MFLTVFSTDSLAQVQKHADIKEIKKKKKEKK